jgi:hypothetical protein
LGYDCEIKVNLYPILPWVCREPVLSADAECLKATFRCGPEGDGQIALIFAIVHYDCHFASAYGCNGIFDRGEGPITVFGFPNNLKLLSRGAPLMAFSQR